MGRHTCTSFICTSMAQNCQVDALLAHIPRVPVQSTLTRATTSTLLFLAMPACLPVLQYLDYRVALPIQLF